MKGARGRRVAVVVIGGGPNGIAVANLLGAYGIDTVVIERETQILEYPRAVGMDDEALRLMQTVGLAEPLVQDMIQKGSNEARVPAGNREG